MMINKQQQPLVRPPMQLSPDGLVRLSLDTILSMHLHHLISGMDEEDPPAPQDCGRQTTLSGYTEWVGDKEPELTIGWDWTVESGGGKTRWTRTGPPRSNIMLIDKDARDVGWEKSLAILATFVDAMAWAEQAMQAITIRYA